MNRWAILVRPSVGTTDAAHLALASMALWLIGIFAFRFGCLGNLLVQVGLFFALTV